MCNTILERKEKLIEYLDLKNESLRFWSDLRDVVHVEGKIKELNSEIAQTKAQLQELVRTEALHA